MTMLILFCLTYNITDAFMDHIDYKNDVIKLTDLAQDLTEQERDLSKDQADFDVTQSHN